MALASLWANLNSTPEAEAAGLRYGNKGTHTSRTMMLKELSDLLSLLPPEATKEDYWQAVVEDNVLGKSTASTRRLTSQRLSELYGLDPDVPIFRALRRLWDIDEAGRPLLALLCALARDPLLRATARTILELEPDEELVRTVFVEDIRRVIGDRLNDEILDKVARNAGSTWTQSGHLVGRVRKIRQRVTPTPGAVALATWLGSLHGYADEALFQTAWMTVFDLSKEALGELVLRAKQWRLLDAHIGGGVVMIDASRLPEWQGR